MLTTPISTQPKRKPRTKLDSSQEQTERKSGDEVWEELFATPESEAFLTLMIAEVRAEEAKGRLIEGGWDEI